MSVGDMQHEIDQERARKARAYDRMVQEPKLKIKPLAWRRVIGAEDNWYAPTPAASNGIYIFYEEGAYWASWDMTIPSNPSAEYLKDLGDAYHKAWFDQWLEKS